MTEKEVLNKIKQTIVDNDEEGVLKILREYIKTEYFNREDIIKAITMAREITLTPTGGGFHDREYDYTQDEIIEILKHD